MNRVGGDVKIRMWERKRRPSGRGYADGIAPRMGGQRVAEVAGRPTPVRESVDQVVGVNRQRGLGNGTEGNT